MTRGEIVAFHEGPEPCITVRSVLIEIRSLAVVTNVNIARGIRADTRESVEALVAKFPGAEAVCRGIDAARDTKP